MVKRHPTPGRGIFFKQWKINHPKRSPAWRNEVEIMTKTYPKRAKRIVDDPLSVCTKKQQIAIFGANAVE
jgi:hypothetical protein